MGNEEMIVGNIASEELIRPDLYNQYMVEGPWISDDDCKKCFFLPICSGGCAWQRVRNKFHGGLYNFCSIYKEGGIDKFLRLYYNKSIAVFYFEIKREWWALGCFIPISNPWDL